MKIIVAVVAFCAALQMVPVRGNLETELGIIDVQMELVQGIVGRLRKLQYVQVFPHVLGFIAAGKEHISEAIETHYNETIVLVEETVANSTAAGKDAAACAATARTDFEMLRTNSSDHFDDCFDVVQSWLYRTEHSMEDGIKAGMAILTYFNTIFPNCYWPDMADIKACVTTMMSNGTNLVETYKDHALAALDDMGNWEPVQKEMSECVDAAQLTVVTEWDTVESNLKQCVTAL